MTETIESEEQVKQTPDSNSETIRELPLVPLRETVIFPEMIVPLQVGRDKSVQALNKAVADGKVTKKERARLEHAQDNQSRKIYRQKHDKQTAK